MTAAVPHAETTVFARMGRIVADLVRRGAAAWIIVAVIVLVMSIQGGGRFWTEGNLAALLTSMVVIGIVSLGQHLVILTGGIDLAVGANVTLVTLLTAVLIDGYPIRTLPVILGVLVLGLLLGAINGALVAWVKLPPFIVTLAALYIVGGAALWVSSTPAGKVTSILSQFAIARIGPIPIMFVVLLALLALVWAGLYRTGWGPQVFAVGGDPHSAHAIGIDVKKVQLSVYAISGLLAAIAGILLAARSTVGSPTAGNGLELSAITAVVIGGTSLLGGKGRLLGTVGGVALLAIITNSVTILQLPGSLTDLIRGVVIIAAVRSVGSNVSAKFNAIARNLT